MSTSEENQNEQLEVKTTKMSCELFDNDQTFIVQDYSPDGYIGPATVNLQHGLKPGGVFSVVSKTSEYMEVNVRDLENNLLLHVVNRVGKNEFALNSWIKSDGTAKWDTEQIISPIPVQKGVRTVTTLIYEAEGWRVFINGKEVSFYKHRLPSEPHKVEIPQYCQIFKIIYLTSKTLVP